MQGPKLRNPESQIANPKSQIVVIGASLGGLHALQTVLATLPAGFPLPVAIVQHREKDTDDTLRTLLQGCCSLPVIEPEDKEPILPGHVYLAPPDYHLLIDCGLRSADFGILRNPQSEIGNHFALSTEAPVNYARPSVDVLFESAADAYHEQAIGVILTGANQDGAAGLAKIKQRGGLAIVQDPQTAEAPTMPEAAIAAVTVDLILPLEEIGAFLARAVLRKT